MPFYDYECTQCGKQFEAEQTFEEHDQHVDHESHQRLACPECGSRKVVQRLTPSYAITSKKS